MKNIETFFTTGNFDTKNITNKSGKVISQSDIDVLESDGATYEILEKLNVPVFKYRTQITIHGQFPTLNNNYIGRYKNIFQNKNMSIGCKYNAIDRFKKKSIFSNVCRYTSGWGIVDNSTEYSLYKCSKYFSDRLGYLEHMLKFKELAKTIDKTLFYGDVRVFLTQSYGGYQMVLQINIGSIKEENVIPLTENICGATMSEIQAKIENDSNERQAKRDKEKLEREEKEAADKLKTAPYFTKAENYLSDKNYKKETIDLVDGLVVCGGVSVNKETLDITYTMVKYSKTKSQKQFRISKINCINEISDNIEFRSSYDKTDKTSIIAYNKAIVDIKPVVVDKVTTKQKTVVCGVEIVDYSEKSIAVIGETKLIKEILKDLGGVFNFRLSCGAGWIFSKKSEFKVREALKL